MDPPTFLTSDLDTDNLVSAVNLEGQSIKRKRLTQACDACRKKKVKCSGDKPSCNNCTRLGTTCTYLPSTRKRGPRVGLVESLEKRLQQMEKLLQPLKEQGIVDNPEDKKPIKKPRLNSKDTETDNSNIPVNPYNERHTQQSFGGQTEFINIFSQPSQTQQQQQQQQHSQQKQTSNVDSIADEDEEEEEEEEEDLIFFGNSSAAPGFVNQREAFVHCDRDPPIKSEPSEINEHSSPSNNSAENIPIYSPITDIISSRNNGLPPEDIVEHLIACYFRLIDIQTSMFHEATFKRQLRQNKINPFLVYTICAVSARYSQNPSIVQKLPYLSGEPFAAIAISKYLFGAFDNPSVENVQGLILLTIHMYGIGKGPSAWMYTGLAVRMAQELGLHKVDEAGSKPNTEGLFIQNEIRRRTFWTCFRLDRLAACALGRPTLIDEDDCDVRLPCNESIWSLEHPFESPLIDEIFKEDQIEHRTRLSLTNIGMGACLVSVTALLGRVCQHVNRSKPYDALPPWDPNSKFAKLEDELDTWYKSLTPHYTYTRERVQQLMADGTGATFALVHLLYYSAIVVLNRPNIISLQNNEVMDCHINFMQASAKRCCAAAKVISSIAEDIVHYGCHICSFALYPVFVTTTIHLNNIYSVDINIAEDAKKGLSTNEQFLKLMEPYWAIASKLLHIVQEMRKVFDASYKENNPEQRVEISIDTDAAFKWNRANNNNSLIESTTPTTNLDNTSIIVPEQLLSPRWYNDTPITGDSWTSFLRSPGPFSPSLLRLMKKENDNSNQDNSYDYFSQDLTSYSSSTTTTLAYDGYPMIDTSSDWPMTGTTGRVFPLSRPIKHWTNINGNIMNSAIEGTPSISTSTTTFTPSLATTTSTSDINIDSLLIYK